jgi:hypothetical protein
MRAFRADKRLFAVGDELSTASEYVRRFDPDRSVFEFVLNLLRPRRLKPRSAYLFVFESLEAARRHWTKMTNGKLYEVEIDESQIKHRGDMALLERAFQSEGWLKRLTSMRAYWRSEMLETPVVEITVPTATVVQVISTSENERLLEFIRSRGLVTGPSVYDPPGK